MSFHKGLHVAGNTSILHTLEHIEEGRSDIYKWSERRLSNRKGIRGKIFFIKKLFINRSMLRSFAQNFSLIVAFQMLLAGLFTYMCVRLELDFDVHMALFVSPVIFPLAFSINADFQRRERVLEDLALFKGALVVLFFCHRDWLTASELAQDFLKTVNNKLRGLVLNIKEYLLTENLMRRQFILSVIYEDFSDISQLNDKMRGSSLPENSPLITRLVHYHNLMCWAFERLRVVREYRSPRTIRSFTKVFIFLMPILLSPYYVHVGKKSGNFWSPYYVAVLSSFIFGSLQGVQDVLDDPFDGISEDDINLGQLEDWTMQSLLTNRTIHVGRFTVTTAVKGNAEDDGILAAEHHYDTEPTPVVLPRKRSILKRNCSRKDEPARNRLDTLETEAKYPEVVSRLENMERRGLTGSTTILPGFQLKQPTISGDSLNSSSAKFLVDIFKLRENGLTVEKGSAAGQKTVSFDDDSFRKKFDWTLGDDEIEGLPADSAKNVKPVPENLREVALDLGVSSGTSLVSSRTPGKQTERQPLPSVLQIFDLPQSSSSDAQVHGDACPTEMPQSLSSLFGNNDQNEAKSSTPTEGTPTKNASLPNTPTRTRRTSTSSQTDPFKVPVSPVSSSAEAPPGATVTTNKPRFAVGPASVTSAEYPSPSCPVPIPNSRFRKKSPEKQPAQSSQEGQPLMSTPGTSYGMTSSSSPSLSSSHGTSENPQNSISKPSRFSVAKSSGIDSSPQVHDTTPQAPDQFKSADESDSIEMEVRKTSQENRSVDDVLNLSHDDSEVYL